MSFFGAAKQLLKNISPLNLVSKFTETLQKTQSLEYTQIRNFKAENFHHSRGLFSNDLSPRGRHYQAKVMKRVRTHGLEVRLETRGGKQMLWRKILKGPKGWTQFVPAP